MQDVGFSGGRHVAACIIYKSLLHSRLFEAERKNVFDRVIQIIGSAIEVFMILLLCMLSTYEVIFL